MFTLLLTFSNRQYSSKVCLYNRIPTGFPQSYRKMKDTEVMMEAAESKNALKFREQLYRLVIRYLIHETILKHTFYLLFLICLKCSQLFYDGFQSLATSLSSAVQAHPTCPPSDRLNHLVTLGLQNEHSKKFFPIKIPRFLL